MKVIYKTISVLLMLNAIIFCNSVCAQDKKEVTTTTDNKDKTGVSNDDKKVDDPNDKAKKEEKERKRWQTFGNYADSLHWLGTINNYPLIFKTNNTEWLRLTTAGRLGLGTSTPSSTFDVIGDIRSSVLGGNGNALIASDKDGTLRRFNFSSDSTHVLYGNGTWAPLPAPIDWQVSGNNMSSIPSGNVGIGVSNASERLEVAGNIKADSIILTKGLSVSPSQVVNITNLTTNNFQTTNIVTSRITPDSTGEITFGSNSLKMIPNSNEFFTDNPDLYIQSKSIYPYNTIINANNIGRVGIGTNAPKAKLHIQSSSPAEVIVEGGDKGYVNAAIVLKATQVANYRGTGIFMHDLNAGNEWFAGRPYGNSNRFVVQYNDANPDHDARTAGLNDGGGASTLSKRYFTIESNGNVGIGQFIPQYTLDVLGTVNAEEYLVGGNPFTSSQWVTSGNNISYSKGRVGIGAGAANPMASLDILGAGDQWIDIGSSSTGSKIRLIAQGYSPTTNYSQLNYNNQFYISPFNSSNTGAAIAFDEKSNVGVGDKPSSTSKLYVRQWYSDDWTASFINGRGAGKGVFIQAAGGGNIPALQVNNNLNEVNFLVTSAGTVTAYKDAFLAVNSGNVGIGTSTPGAKFTVEDAVSQNQIIASFNGKEAGTTRKIFMVPKLSNGGYNGLSKSGDMGIFWTDGQSSGTNSSAGLVIAPWSDGNDGIRLDADGTFQVKMGITKFVAGSAESAALGYGTSYIGFNSRRQVSNWLVENDGAHNGGGLIFADLGGNIRFISVPNTGANNQILTDAQMLANTKMLISADGKIYTREVVVSTTWSDFVFEKNYKLMPLTEVNSFIQKNKHLPGIPSAKEIQTNGLKVAEAQTLMMQKIEELTLYLLEQNKQLQELQKQNKLLEQKVNAMDKSN